VELLVVLVILAALTMVAIQATDIFVDQSRYDATDRSLTSIREAIMSSQRQADGSLLLTGFAVDMGRLPNQADVTPQLAFGELWDINGSLPIYHLASVPNGHAAFSDVGDLRIGSGYRGPYLRLPTSSQAPNLLDGWGNPYQIVIGSGNVAFQSNGGPAGPYQGLLPATPIRFTQNLPPPSSDFIQVRSNVSGIVKERVIPSDGGLPFYQAASNVRCYLLEPDGNGEVNVHSFTTAVDGNFSFTNVRVGPRVIRIAKEYQTGMAGSPTNQKVVDTLPVIVTPGGIANLNLNLIAPQPPA